MIHMDPPQTYPLISQEAAQKREKVKTMEMALALALAMDLRLRTDFSDC